MSDGHTILHIDDDPQLIGLVRTALNRAGYTVIDAFSGFTGLQAAAEHQPDAILLEMSISDMDGWQVFEALRADIETAAIPVIALTPRAQSIDRVLELQTAGIDEYLIKPFSTEDLLESIRRAIEGR